MCASVGYSCLSTSVGPRSRLSIQFMSISESQGGRWMGAGGETKSLSGEVRGSLRTLRGPRLSLAAHCTFVQCSTQGGEPYCVLGLDLDQGVQGGHCRQPHAQDHSVEGARPGPGLRLLPCPRLHSGWCVRVWARVYVNVGVSYSWGQLRVSGSKGARLYRASFFCDDCSRW